MNRENMYGPTRHFHTTGMTRRVHSLKQKSAPAPFRIDDEERSTRVTLFRFFQEDADRP